MGPIIDLTQLLPYRIILHLAEGFAVFNICHSLLKDKYNSVITFMAALAVRVIVAQLLFDTQFYIVSYLVLGIVLILIFKVLTNGEVSKIVIS